MKDVCFRSKPVESDPNPWGLICLSCQFNRRLESSKTDLLSLKRAQPCRKKISLLMKHVEFGVHLNFLKFFRDESCKCAASLCELFTGLLCWVSLDSKVKL